MSLLSFFAVVNVNLCIKDKKFYQYKNRYKNIWFRNRKIYGYGMKNKYKLNPSDKFNKMLNNISMIQTFLDVLK